MSLLEEIKKRELPRRRKMPIKVETIDYNVNEFERIRKLTEEFLKRIKKVGKK